MSQTPYQSGEEHYAVDVARPWHSAWWASQLARSAEIVVEATNALGVQAKDVRVWLARFSWPTHRHKWTRIGHDCERCPKCGLVRITYVAL
jgi:hypothetical protein